ncbi:MAG: GIY-YIG nuclease family protein [Patescibacteria group bacterium]|nr:GIY-YIG nuclease family protein [Patescibacteria group bacterium]
MHYVYILISKARSNWSYVGSTSNLEQRFCDHKYGKVKSTKGCRPLLLIYSEELLTREDAYARELFLKSGIGREEKAVIIKNYYSGIV